MLQIGSRVLQPAPRRAAGPGRSSDRLRSALTRTSPFSIVTPEASTFATRARSSAKGRGSAVERFALDADPSQARQLLGDVDMEVADRIGLGFCAWGKFRLRLAAREIPWRCRQRCRRRAPQMRDGRLQGVQAVVERRQNMSMEGDDDGHVPRLTGLSIWALSVPSAGRNRRKNAPAKEGTKQLERQSVAESGFRRGASLVDRYRTVVGDACGLDGFD